jgi:hypothetical protein
MTLITGHRHPQHHAHLLTPDIQIECNIIVVSSGTTRANTYKAC